MANNYSSFSVSLEDISEPELKWWTNVCDLLGNEVNLENLPESCRDEPSEVYDVIDVDGASVWIHGDNGIPDGVVDLVQLFFKQFRPKEFLPIEVAFHCSKPRVGEFGGAWIAISANEVRCGDTSSAIREAMKEMGYVEE